MLNLQSISNLMTETFKIDGLGLYLTRAGDTVEVIEEIPKDNPDSKYWAWRAIVVELVTENGNATRNYMANQETRGGWLWVYTSEGHWDAQGFGRANQPNDLVSKIEHKPVIRDAPRFFAVI